MLRPKALRGGAVVLEAVTLAEARDHLRLDVIGGTHPDDSMIETALIPAAREAAEHYTEATFARRAFTAIYDGFDDSGLSLGTGPVISVSSVAYKDENNASQVLDVADYVLDNVSKPGAIYPAFSTEFPATNGMPGSVVVTFLAGPTDGLAEDVEPLPLIAKQAILLILGHLYENRQDVGDIQMHALPMGARALLQPLRLGQGM